MALVCMFPEKGGVSGSHREITGSDEGLWQMANNKSRELDWSDEIQGMVLSAHYYGYLMSPMFGGYLATRYGGKQVIVVSMTTTVVATLLTPVSALYSPYAVIALRFLIGLSTGPVSPAMQEILNKWAPVSDKVKLISYSWAGDPAAMETSGDVTSVNGMLVLPVCERHEPDSGWNDFTVVHEGRAGLPCRTERTVFRFTSDWKVYRDAHLRLPLRLYGPKTGVFPDHHKKDIFGSRYASVLVGALLTVSGIAGILVPLGVTVLTADGTREQWQLIFIICTVLCVVATLIFSLLGSAEEQNWAKYQPLEMEVEGDTGSTRRTH
ncbi:uncharacterized transporter slc-17.2-like [Liolophura sinensis]|uniref:uncharacterized transporter slc-17.2-like n=1 Tax=Liolophura sinensis TaxID=3198878 RepID=UPI0031585D4E